jgi:2-polyprenyl-3-methyl-5-hydroxy-6-metoxy-1,4-benzoquinol methylase
VAEKILNFSEVVSGKEKVYRSVESDDYTKNFSIQWNAFAQTQLDEHLGAPLSFDRLMNTTKWSPQELSGAIILEIGAGAGRFTSELLRNGATVVAVDLSTAIDANFSNNSTKGNLICIQADIYDLPLKFNSFPRVLCLGVLQHTPNRWAALSAIWSMVSPGGELVFDIYAVARRPSPYFFPKYLWRPFTRKMKPETLLKLVRWYIPKYISLDTKIKKLPFGVELSGLIPIPCFNHLTLNLTEAERLEWAILDTFDALGAYYDRPATLRALRKHVLKLPNLEFVDLSRGHSARLRKSTK